MFQRLRVIAQSLGFAPRRRGRSVLVWGSDDQDAFTRAEPIVSELSRRYPRLNFYRVSPSPEVRARLAAGGSASEILAPPVGFGPWLRLYLARSKAQILLLADGLDEASEKFVRQAASRRVAIAAVRPPGGGKASRQARARNGTEDLVDLYITFDRTDAERLRRRSGERAAGRAAGRAKVLLWTSPEEMEGADLFEAFQLRMAAGGDRAGGAAPGRGLRARRLAATLGSIPLSPVLRWKYRRIPTLAALREELGRPDTILCLGNGPSSEDPRLADLAYDALFRVNHGWQARGFLMEPRMVFTGLKTTVAAVRGPVVFAFQTRRLEKRLLLKCLAIPRRIAYTTAESLGMADFGGIGEYVVTNGAVMLATAVALRPRNLIVAGMDFYQHPSGGYPGDTETPNAYALFHDRETELRSILGTLDRYDGNLTIVSEVLNEYWRAHNDPAIEQEARPRD